MLRLVRGFLLRGKVPFLLCGAIYPLPRAGGGSSVGGSSQVAREVSAVLDTLPVTRSPDALAERGRKRRGFDAIIQWCWLAVDELRSCDGTRVAPGAPTVLVGKDAQELDCAALQWVVGSMQTFTCGQALMALSFVCEVLRCRCALFDAHRRLVPSSPAVEERETAALAKTAAAAAAPTDGGASEAHAQGRAQLVNCIALLQKYITSSETLETQSIPVLTSALYSLHVTNSQMRALQYLPASPSEKELLRIAPAMMFALLNQIRSEGLNKLFEHDEPLGLEVVLSLLTILDANVRKAYLPDTDTTLLLLLRRAVASLESRSFLSEPVDRLLSRRAAHLREVESDGGTGDNVGAVGRSYPSPPLRDAVRILQNVGSCRPQWRYIIARYVLCVCYHPSDLQTSEEILLGLRVLGMASQGTPTAVMTALREGVVAHLPLPLACEPLLVARMASMAGPGGSERFVQFLTSTAVDSLPWRSCAEVLSLIGVRPSTSPAWERFMGRVLRPNLGPSALPPPSLPDDMPDPEATAERVVAAASALIKAVSRGFYNATDPQVRPFFEVVAAAITPSCLDRCPPALATRLLGVATLLSTVAPSNDVGFDVPALGLVAGRRTDDGDDGDTHRCSPAERDKALVKIISAAFASKEGTYVARTLRVVAGVIPFISCCSKRTKVVEELVRYNGSRSMSSVLRFATILSPLAVEHRVHAPEIVSLLMRWRSIQRLIIRSPKDREDGADMLWDGVLQPTRLIAATCAFVQQSREWEANNKVLKGTLESWVAEYFRILVLEPRNATGDCTQWQTRARAAADTGEEAEGQLAPADDDVGLGISTSSEASQKVGAGGDPADPPRDAASSGAPRTPSLLVSDAELEELLQVMLLCGIKLPDGFIALYSQRIGRLISQRGKFACRLAENRVDPAGPAPILELAPSERVQLLRGAQLPLPVGHFAYAVRLNIALPRLTASEMEAMLRACPSGILHIFLNTLLLHCAKVDSAVRRPNRSERVRTTKGWAAHDESMASVGDPGERRAALSMVAMEVALRVIVRRLELRAAGEVDTALTGAVPRILCPSDPINVSLCLRYLAAHIKSTFSRSEVPGVESTSGSEKGAHAALHGHAAPVDHEAVVDAGAALPHPNDCLELGGADAGTEEAGAAEGLARQSTAGAEGPEAGKLDLEVDEEDGPMEAPAAVGLAAPAAGVPRGQSRRSDLDELPEGSPRAAPEPPAGEGDAIPTRQHLEELLCVLVSQLSAQEVQHFALASLQHVAAAFPVAADFLFSRLSHSLENLSQMELLHVSCAYPKEQERIAAELRRHNIALTVDYGAFLRFAKATPEAVLNAVVDAHLPTLSIHLCARTLGALSSRQSNTPYRLLNDVLHKVMSEMNDASEMDRNVLLIVVQRCIEEAAELEAREQLLLSRLRASSDGEAERAARIASSEARLQDCQRRLVDLHECCRRVLVVETITDVAALQRFFNSCPKALHPLIAGSVANQVRSAIVMPLLRRLSTVPGEPMDRPETTEDMGEALPPLLHSVKPEEMLPALTGAVSLLQDHRMIPDDLCSIIAEAFCSAYGSPGDARPATEPLTPLVRCSGDVESTRDGSALSRCTFAEAARLLSVLHRELRSRLLKGGGASVPVTKQAMPCTTARTDGSDVEAVPVFTEEVLLRAYAAYCSAFNTPEALLHLLGSLTAPAGKSHHALPPVTVAIATMACSKLVSCCDLLSSTQLSQLTFSLSKLNLWSLTFEPEAGSHTGGLSHSRVRRDFADKISRVFEEADAHNRCVILKALSTEPCVMAEFQDWTVRLMIPCASVLSGEDIELVLGAVCDMALTEDLEGLIDTLGTRMLCILPDCRRSTAVRMLRCLAQFDVSDMCLGEALLQSMDEHCSRAEYKLSTAQILVLLNAAARLDLLLPEKLAVWCFSRLESALDSMNGAQLAGCLRAAVGAEMGYTASIHAIGSKASDMRESLRTDSNFRDAMEMFCEEYSAEVPPQMRVSTMRAARHKTRIANYWSARRQHEQQQQQQQQLAAGVCSAVGSSA